MFMATTPTPTKIEPLSDTELFLAFSNEEEYAVPYLELRYHCPCAGCVDEHTGQRTIKKESISPKIKPTGVQLIGRYAVQINWSDRHATGMYHYDRLFEMSGQFGRRLK
jgi:DUF971 family protein